MKHLLILTTVILISLLNSTELKASHAMGNNINVTWNGGGQYQFELIFYRDCAGVSAPTSANLSIQSVNCGISTTIVLSLTSTASGLSICGAPNTCNGGVLPGYEVYTYTGLYNTPTSMSCSDWIFSYNLCCRNSDITNLVNPDSEELYSYVSMDLASTPFNNSIVFNNRPVTVLVANQPFTIGFGGIDIDGDSIVYRMVTPQGANGVLIPYVPGYSVSNPFQSSTPITFDSNTGYLSGHPTFAQSAVIAIEADEYRFGQLISTSRRDIQLSIVSSTTTNNVPELTGVDGTSSFVTHVCADSLLNFDVYATDADSGQNLNFHIISAPIGFNLTIDSSNTTAPVLTVEANTHTGMVSGFPYNIIVEVRDDACPVYGSQQYTYQVFVNACAVTDVWPGDANNDYRCDVTDILPIGIGYGTTGIARANPSTIWQAQASQDWFNTFLSGVNYKFADCNGDGVIDNSDLAVMNANLNNTHQKTSSLKQGGPNDPPIYMTGLSDTVTSGTASSFAVHLGNDSVTATSVYGVAVDITFNTSQIDYNSVEIVFDNSTLSTANNDLLTVVNTIEFTAGLISVGLTRYDGTPIDMSGELFTVLYTPKVSSTSSDSVKFEFSNVTMVDNTGEELDYNTVNTSQVVVEPVDTTTIGIENLNAPIQFNLFPNPSTGVFNLQTYASAKKIQLTVINTTGAVVYQADVSTSNTRLDLKALPSGIYMVKLTDGKDTVVKRAVIY